MTTNFARILLTLCLTGAALTAVGAELPAEARQVMVETQGAVAAEGANEALPVKAADESAPVATGETSQKMGEALSSTAKATLPESEIPIDLDKKKSTGDAGSMAVRVLFAFIVLAALGGGAFVLYRRHGRPAPRQHAPQIKVLTQHWLGPKKSLAIVRVAGESILIGVTDSNISMIKSLALLDEEIPEETPKQFTSVLDRVGMKDKEIEETVATGDGEDFAMSGIAQVRDVVSRRMKGMRSIE